MGRQGSGVLTVSQRQCALPKSKNRRPEPGDKACFFTGQMANAQPQQFAALLDELAAEPPDFEEWQIKWKLGSTPADAWPSSCS